MLLSKPFLKNKVPALLSFAFSTSKQDANSSLSYYKNKRIYKDKSSPELLNQLFINELCRHEIFVRNSLKLYHLSRTCLGTKRNYQIIYFPQAKQSANLLSRSQWERFSPLALKKLKSKIVFRNSTKKVQKLCFFFT